MIGKSGERGSGISVLAAQHDDDDCSIPSVPEKILGSFAIWFLLILLCSWLAQFTIRKTFLFSSATSKTASKILDHKIHNSMYFSDLKLPEYILIL